MAFLSIKLVAQPSNMKRNQQTKNQFLLVGINKFVKYPSMNLEYCVPDAMGLKAAFNDEEDKTVLLTDEKANRENILNETNKMLESSRKGDLMVIYLATHGLITHNDFFFFPHDADPNNILGTGIPSVMLINALSIKAKEGVNILLILDACHSASVGFDIAKMYNPDGKGGISLMFSSSPMELSMEGPQFAGGHGAFTSCLMEGLAGAADSDKNGAITIREMFDFAYIKVKKLTSNRQNPVLIGTLDSNIIIKGKVNADEQKNKMQDYR
jgi:uncharacterized caspase-like protein